MGKERGFKMDIIITITEYVRRFRGMVWAEKCSWTFKVVRKNACVCVLEI